MFGAIKAVFLSWESKRAKTYRKFNHIPGDWGTAVNVQSMVLETWEKTAQLELHLQEIHQMEKINFLENI